MRIVVMIADLQQGSSRNGALDGWTDGRPAYSTAKHHNIRNVEIPIPILSDAVHHGGETTFFIFSHTESRKLQLHTLFLLCLY